MRIYIQSSQPCTPGYMGWRVGLRGARFPGGIRPSRSLMLHGPAPNQGVGCTTLVLLSSGASFPRFRLRHQPRHSTPQAAHCSHLASRRNGVGMLQTWACSGTLDSLFGMQGGVNLHQVPTVTTFWVVFWCGETHAARLFRREEEDEGVMGDPVPPYPHPTVSIHNRYEYTVHILISHRQVYRQRSCTRESNIQHNKTFPTPALFLKRCVCASARRHGESGVPPMTDFRRICRRRFT